MVVTPADTAPLLITAAEEDLIKVVDSMLLKNARGNRTYPIMVNYYRIMNEWTHSWSLVQINAVIVQAYEPHWRVTFEDETWEFTPIAQS